MNGVIIFLWIVLAIVVGFVATQKKRDFVGFFFLSLLISPIISLLILIAIPVKLTEDENLNSKTRQCPHCAETIKNEAVKCKHCGSGVEKIEEEIKTTEVDNDIYSVPKEKWTTISCPNCSQEELTLYPKYPGYYKKFKAKDCVFSSDIKLNCKQCKYNFIYTS